MKFQNKRVKKKILKTSQLGIRNAWDFKLEATR